jgi:WD40 repeat protein
LKQKSLTTIGNFHDSRISYLKTVKVLDTELIISASYDHTWKLTPIDFSTNQLGQSVTFQAHSGWITSASYNESTNQLITAGNDKVLFKWHINLEEIVNKFNKI